MAILLHGHQCIGILGSCWNYCKLLFLNLPLLILSDPLDFCIRLIFVKCLSVMIYIFAGLFFTSVRCKLICSPLHRNVSVLFRCYGEKIRKCLLFMSWLTKFQLCFYLHFASYPDFIHFDLSIGAAHASICSSRVHNVWNCSIGSF